LARIPGNNLGFASIGRDVSCDANVFVEKGIFGAAELWTIIWPVKHGEVLIWVGLT
jgi:hypothetical protein